MRSAIFLVTAMSCMVIAAGFISRGNYLVGAVVGVVGVYYVARVFLGDRLARDDSDNKSTLPRTSPAGAVTLPTPKPPPFVRAGGHAGRTAQEMVTTRRSSSGLPARAIAFREPATRACDCPVAVFSPSCSSATRKGVTAERNLYRHRRPAVGSPSDVASGVEDVRRRVWCSGSTPR